MLGPIKTTITCTCGKVKATIDSPSALRLVCHCVDCRGYYLALDKRSNHTLGPLTPWGGVDWTQVYPNEVTIDSGMEELALCRINPNYSGSLSGMPRVYAKCCNTPLYNHGMTIMVNTHLIPETDRIPVKYNIMGRMALEPKEQYAGKRPNIASSVPFSFCFNMIGRAARGSSRKYPSPWVHPELEDAEVIELEPYKKPSK